MRFPGKPASALRLHAACWNSAFTDCRISRCREQRLRSKRSLFNHRRVSSALLDELAVLLNDEDNRCVRRAAQTVNELHEADAGIEAIYAAEGENPRASLRISGGARISDRIELFQS